MENDMKHIDIEKIEANSSTLKATFNDAKPYKYVVIDAFLRPDSVEHLLKSITAPDPKQKSSDYLFAKNKFENPGFAQQSDVLAEIRDELLSPRFAKVLSDIYGKELFVDPMFVGGGIHQGGAGSFLDMHADFNRHPANADWLREINILLYLNKDYKEEYGGHLEMEHAHTHERGRVAPMLNRLVLMQTNDYTLHGYKPINFPSGTYRTSLAAYAYSLDTEGKAGPQRSTVWKPENASLAKVAFAKVSPRLVKVKNALFGSSTVRRASGKKD